MTFIQFIDFLEGLPPFLAGIIVIGVLGIPVFLVVLAILKERKNNRHNKEFKATEKPDIAEKRSSEVDLQDIVNNGKKQEPVDTVARPSGKQNVSYSTCTDHLKSDKRNSSFESSGKGTFHYSDNSARNVNPQKRDRSSKELDELVARETKAQSESRRAVFYKDPEIDSPYIETVHHAVHFSDFKTCNHDVEKTDEIVSKQNDDVGREPNLKLCPRYIEVRVNVPTWEEFCAFDIKSYILEHYTQRMIFDTISLGEKAYANSRYRRVSDVNTPMLTVKYYYRKYDTVIAGGQATIDLAGFKELYNMKRDPEKPVKRFKAATKILSRYAFLSEEYPRHVGSDCSGIYVLLFYAEDPSRTGKGEKYDDIYVGQSLNVYTRVKEHLECRSHLKKVQTLLNEGCYVYARVYECEESELNFYEKYCIMYWEATQSLNTTRGGGKIRETMV